MTHYKALSCRIRLLTCILRRSSFLQNFLFNSRQSVKIYNLPLHTITVFQQVFAQLSAIFWINIKIQSNIEYLHTWQYYQRHHWIFEWNVRSEWQTTERGCRKNIKLSSRSISPSFLMTESASRQDEANPAFCLATRLARSGFPALVPQVKVLFFRHVINLYWPNLFGQDGRILASFFVCFYWPRQKELGQYPAILTTRLVNNACLLAHSR